LADQGNFLPRIESVQAQMDQEISFAAGREKNLTSRTVCVSLIVLEAADRLERAFAVVPVARLVARLLNAPLSTTGTAALRSSWP